MDIKPKILRMVKLDGKLYFEQDDICNILKGIKNGCGSLEGIANMKELLKVFGCEPCEENGKVIKETE